MKPGVALLAAAMLAGSCSPERPAVPAAAAGQGQETRPAAESPPSPLAPVAMTVRQRSTTPVPGSDGNLLLTIDDITRDQVIVSLAPKENGILLAPASMTSGAMREFHYLGNLYQLRLVNLETHLLSADFATFDVGPPGPSEKEKVDRLLTMLGSLRGMTFHRNDQKMTPSQAAAHLRLKWLWNAEGAETASEFVDRIATRSSNTGAAYLMEMRDGKVVEAGVWFRARLVEIERRP